MDLSPRLSLSYVMPAQAQKHVTVNETFRRLDQLVQQTVKSRTTAAEPAAPAEGDAYILPAGATGAAWSGYAADSIAAYQDGAWAHITPAEGFRAWVADDDELAVFDGAAWGALTGSGGGSETAAKFGVHTSADATNKLSVKSNAVLFDALDAAESGGGDCQVKINKETVSDTASVLFQSNFSGRAEFGLTGDDDFHIKVSPDNFTTTYDAIVIDKDNGNIGIGTSSPKSQFHVKNATTSELILSGQLNSGVSSQISMYEDETASSEYGMLLSYVGSTNIFEISGVSAGAATVRMSVYRDGGLVVGAPTGGNKGAGALNAQAVYDDNTLLTCYVFDQALDGAIDEAKWDEKVPDRIVLPKTDRNEKTGEELVVEPGRMEKRRHEPMRKFKTRINSVHDPLDLDGYAKHWREKRHLTSLPNEAGFDPVSGQLTTGEWIQRLVETVEIQAVLIEQLNERTKPLRAVNGAS